MLAGGQRQSCQRIVWMRKYSTRMMESRGRAFDSIKATVSTGPSGFLPCLCFAHLSFAVDIHALGSGRRRCALESASLRHAEDCGTLIRSCRWRVPQARRYRQGHAAGWSWCRFPVSAGGDRLSPCRRRCRCGEGCAGPVWRRQLRDAWCACASVISGLTTADRPLIARSS